MKIDKIAERINVAKDDIYNLFEEKGLIIISEKVDGFVYYITELGKQFCDYNIWEQSGDHVEELEWYADRIMELVE
jgi:DNA-binding PadR family transcriptional regulator